MNSTNKKILIVMLWAIVFGAIIYWFLFSSSIKTFEENKSAESICSNLKFVNETHTLFYPLLDADLSAMLTENNLMLDQIDYAGVDKIVGRVSGGLSQIVARCIYHVRKCRLLESIYPEASNSTDFLCSDLSLMVGVKQLDVYKWRSSLEQK